MPTLDSTRSTLMAALEQFEATEANLIKLERLGDEIASMIPTGIAFGANVEYEDRVRSFCLLLAGLPKIGGWKPAATPPDLDGLAQSRLDAMEIDEPSVHVTVERWIEEPGRELHEYRFRFNNMRRALIRDALIGLIDQIDADIRTVRATVAVDAERPEQIEKSVWSDMREHMKQIEVLLGSSVKKPARWSDMMRHMHFGCVGDLHDIEAMDWPDVKGTLRKGVVQTNRASSHSSRRI